MLMWLSVCVHILALHPLSFTCANSWRVIIFGDMSIAKDERGTIILMKYFRSKSRNLLLIHTLWQGFLISWTSFLSFYSTTSFILWNPEETLHLQTWLTKYWHKESLLPVSDLKWYIISVFYFPSKDQCQRKKKLGRSWKYSFIGMAEGKKERRRKTRIRFFLALPIVL